MDSIALRRVRLLPLLGILLGVFGCRSPEPGQELEVTDVETYWVIDPSVGETQYLAPAVRFRLRNKGTAGHRTIQANAVFRRKGEDETWGSDWQRVLPGGQAVEPGDDAVVVLKSDARYYSTGDPETMFTHAEFKDTGVKVFVRLASSGWVEMVDTPVERRIGSRSVQVTP